jgi:hypothetical protein
MTLRVQNILHTDSLFEKLFHTREVYPDEKSPVREIIIMSFLFFMFQISNLNLNEKFQFFFFFGRKGV